MNKPETITTIEIDGQRFEVSSTVENQDPLNSPSHARSSADKEDIYHFKNEGKTFHIQVLGYDAITHTYKIEIDGQLKSARIFRPLDIMIEKMGLNTTHAKRLSIMEAPMPGLVTVIKAKIGQSVKKGDPLIILEAMKMENVIAAPHDAVIKEISVTIGQAVERGFPLLEFE